MIEQLASHPKLLSLQKKLAETHIRDLFAQDPNRYEQFSVQGAQLFLDYSKNRITPEVMQVLSDLLDESGYAVARRSLFNGELLKSQAENAHAISSDSVYHLNSTENRQVLHTALRLPEDLLKTSKELPDLPNKVIREEVLACRQKMKAFVERVHREEVLGYTGKPIKTIVSIGIGGSFLGPKVATQALKAYTKPGYACHYIANIDSSDFVEVFKKIDIETSLFLVQSKTFGTLETLTNANSVKAYLLKNGMQESDFSHHFYAVSSNVEAAVQYGVKEENVFPMWDWVGGRYSMWSAIGLPIAFLLGYDNFDRMLQGAHEIDLHFRNAPNDQNIPVILALLGVWYHNYFNAQSHAVLPYSHYLKFLPDHLQQLDMESNGKNTDRFGCVLRSTTGPVIWGGEGTNGQHAYHQLLHQGSHLIPCDFIISLTPLHPIGDHHQQLFANCLSQTRALMEGKTQQQAYDELIASGMDPESAAGLAPHKVYPGNRPSNTLMYEQLSPEVLGALIATYEHKVFVQGQVWGINSFDQWGVELGKTMSQEIYEMLTDDPDNPSEDSLDSSSKGLIKKFKTSNNTQ